MVVMHCASVAVVMGVGRFVNAKCISSLILYVTTMSCVAVRVGGGVGVVFL